MAYAENAMAERRAAARETLPQRKLQHERSAERWEDMARHAEEVSLQAQTNAESKRANPHHQAFRRQPARSAIGASGS